MTPALLAAVVAGIGSGILGLLIWDWLGEWWAWANGDWLLATPLALFSLACGTLTHILMEIP